MDYGVNVCMPFFTIFKVNVFNDLNKGLILIKADFRDVIIDLLVSFMSFL